MTLDLSNAPLTKHGTPPAHELRKSGTSIKRLNAIRYAEWGIQNQAHFSYSEAANRSQMFDLKPCTIPPSGAIHADCSQFVASCLHWAGVPGLTRFDYTGTLWDKGKVVDLAHAQPGDVVIFGAKTGVHAALLIEHDPDGWFTASFGHSPGAPNRVSLANFIAYFAKSHPGVRVLSFTP